MLDYLTELQTEYEQIAHNQIGRFEPGLSVDEVISACEKIVNRRREFHKKTDSILREQLYPILENITEITDEDEAELYATAQKLSSYAERLDPGLALKIYQGLHERAHCINDETKIIKYSYWCGITMFFFFRGQNLNSDQDAKILAYFEKGASYKDRYYTYSDSETRQYIHRCMGNISMMYYFMDRAADAKELDDLNFSFWNEILFTGKDLDFPWLSYFLASLNHRHSYLMEVAHSEPDKVTRAEMKDILDLSITINNLYKKNSSLFRVFGGTRYEFTLWEAQFLAGLISFDHLQENIIKKKTEFAPEDYSSDAMYVKIQLNSYLMFYAAKMRRLRDRKDEIIGRISREAIESFSHIPMTVSPSNVSEHLQFFAKNLSDVFDPGEQMDFILKMTTFRHIPTYAHSIMVGKIAKYLTENLFASNPGHFTGLLGIENEDSLASRMDEILRIVDKGSLCHDIGKISYVSNPFMHTRILTEEEYAIIKRHPVDGASMIERDDEPGGNTAYVEITKGHHNYFDNSDGYPVKTERDTQSYKAIVDIISVANAIDAATDGISKTYTAPKDAKTILNEIIEGAGTRYSPSVAEVLKGEAALKDIEHILETERKSAYYTAYLHSWEEF